MIPHAMVVRRSVKSGPRVGDAATQRPATSAGQRRTIPAAVASTVFPGRQTFIQNPMPKAIGMVQRMVKTPHGECGQRLDDDQRQHRQQDHHDGEDGDHRERTR